MCLLKKRITHSFTRAIAAEEAIKQYIENPIDKLVLICLAASSVTDIEVSTVLKDESILENPIVLSEHGLYIQDIESAICVIQSKVGLETRVANQSIQSLINQGDVFSGIAPPYEAQQRKNNYLRAPINHDPCSVYVMTSCEDDLIKIGISKDPIAREKSLNSAFPRDVKLYWSVNFDNRDRAKKIETRAHEEFDSFRTTGEWFHLDKDIAVSTIQDLCGEIS